MAKHDASTPGRPSGPAATDGLTRQQVARQLGVGITTVLRMCQRGELHPKQAANGFWRYDPAEVVRVSAQRTPPARRTAGHTSAAAFHMFETGGELKDIVMALALTPEEVLRLYKYWQRSLDEGPLESELPGGGAALLDEDPRAEEAFIRQFAETEARYAPHPPTPKASKTKGRTP